MAQGSHRYQTRVVITGAENALPDYEFSPRNFNVRMAANESTRLLVTVPHASDVLEEMLARPLGTVNVFFSVDGGPETPLFSGAQLGYEINRGASAESISLRAEGTIAPVGGAVVAWSSIIRVRNTISGESTWTAPLSAQIVVPGDTVGYLGVQLIATGAVYHFAGKSTVPYVEVVGG